MDNSIVYDYSLKEKFLDFCEVCKIYNKLHEEEKENMIFLEEISENPRKLENYFETMEDVIKPLISHSRKVYFIDSSISYYEDNSESHNLEISKYFNFNLPTGRRKNSKIFFSWKRNREGIEKILCGLDFRKDTYVKTFWNTNGRELCLDEINFIPSESEVNDWILDQILLDKKRKNSHNVFHKHF